MKLTVEEFEALPVVAGRALYVNPNDERCGFIADQRGVQWIVGFDGDTLSRASRDGILNSAV